MADELARLERELEDGGNLIAHIHRGLEVVGGALRLFSPQEIALTFNGGKDACVVLHLLRIELERQGRGGGQQAGQGEGLRAFKVVYFEPKKEFPEITAFMTEMAERYHFSYTVYHGSYKEGMEDLVKNHGIKAVLMGVRRGDPFTDGSEHFSPSSEGWPAFMRVYPILRWDYGHVWRFMRGLQLPYCSLYDRGYTSIGDYSTTVPNPALLNEESGEYLPAYELQDYSVERSNRLSGPGGSSTMAPPEISCKVKKDSTVESVVQLLHQLPVDLDFVIILCIDQDAEVLIRDAIQRFQSSLSPCSNSATRPSPLILPEPLPPAPPGASSPSPSHTLLMRGWQQDGPVSSYGNVCILSHHFELLDAGERKAALERVLHRGRGLRSPTSRRGPPTD